MIRKIVITLLVLSMAAILYIGHTHPFTKGYHLYFHLYNAKGLERGDAAFVRGVRAGYVSAIALERDDEGNARVKVDVWLKENFRVEKNAEALVTPYGLMGGKYFSVFPGTPGIGIAEPEDHFYYKKKITLGELLRVDKNTTLPDFSKSKFADTEFVDRLREKIFRWNEMADTFDRKLTGKDAVIKKKFQSTYKSTDEWISKLHKVLPRIEKLSVRLNRTLDDTGMRFTKRIADFRTRADTAARQWNKTIKNIQKKVSEKRITIIDRADSIDSGLKKFHRISTDWQETLAAMDNILDRILNGKGVVRKLLDDKKMARQVEKIFSHAEGLTQKTEEVLRDIRLNPEKYTTIYLIGRKEKQKKK